jgi:gliding motility-associated-like protein
MKKLVVGFGIISVLSLQVNGQTSCTISVNSVSICTGASTVLTASGATSYTWAPAAGLSATTGNAVTANPLTSTTYTVTGQSACGTAISTSTVTILPTPTASIIGANINCEAINATMTGQDGTAPYTFSYLIGDVTKSSASAANSTDFVLLKDKVSPGSYTVSLVSVSDANGCKATIADKELLVDVKKNPIAFFTVSPEVTTTLQPIVSVVDESLESVSWQWNWGDGEQSSSATPDAHTYAAEGTYPITLTTTNEFGCRDYTTQTVIINKPFTLYVPNAFTPNNEAPNDFFIPQASGIRDYKMTIYDSFGGVLFHSDDIDTGWDGRVEGSNTIAQLDTYVYVIQVKSEANNNDYTYRGSLNLVR